MATVAGEQARARLLDAAERLIALHGPEVPLRRIVQESGQRNNSAVTYHFGSRRGLLEAVWERRTQRVNAERAAMLEEIDARGAGHDLTALVRAHVLPMAREIRNSLPSYWARFNEIALAGMPTMFIATFATDLDSYGDRDVPLRTLAGLLQRMRLLVADGVEPQAGMSVSLMVRFVVSSLASWERDQERGLVDADSLVPFADGLIEAAVVLLSHAGTGLGAGAAKDATAGEPLPADVAATVTPLRRSSRSA